MVPSPRHDEAAQLITQHALHLPETPSSLVPPPHTPPPAFPSRRRREEDGAQGGCICNRNDDYLRTRQMRSHLPCGEKSRVIEFGSSTHHAGIWWNPLTTTIQAATNALREIRSTWKRKPLVNIGALSGWLGWNGHAVRSVVSTCEVVATSRKDISVHARANIFTRRVRKLSLNCLSAGRNNI